MGRIEDKTIKVTCSFCGESLDDYEYFPPPCQCEQSKELERKRIEESEVSTEDLCATMEEYDKKFPIVFKGVREVQEVDNTHKVTLEARQHKSGIGLTLKFPFGEEDDSPGLCIDFTSNDSEALYSLLKEYLEGISEYTRPC